MEKIIEKVEKYNIFTNIIPGYLIILFNIYYFKLENINIFHLMVLAYFIGSTLSRIGSILVGNILLRFSMERGQSYDKYICACKEDDMINVLLQERNTYRTFCTLFIVCIIEILISKILVNVSISKDTIILILLIIGFIIYSISFCKYNKYIADRVRISNKKTKK